jgi:phospholipid/cholesterol/gamma-HCH transport system substrate-binding protein
MLVQVERGRAQLSEQSQDKLGGRGRRKIRLAVAAVVVLVVAIVLYRSRGAVLAALATGPEYLATFKSVGGLRKGDEVRYGGIPVGRTRSVRIDPADPSRLIVVFRVRRDTPMRADMRASVVDLTSPVTRYLSLRPGTRDAPPLPPGHEVQSETGPTIDETLTNATILIARADTLLEAASPLMHGDFFARLDRMTVRLDQMTGVLARSSARWAPELERAAGRMNDLLARSDRLLATIDSTRPDLRAASAEALAMLRDTRTLVGELRTGAAEGGGVSQLMRNLTLTSDNLSRLAARLDRNPASLLRRQPPPPKPGGPSLP